LCFQYFHSLSRGRFTYIWVTNELTLEMKWQKKNICELFSNICRYLSLYSFFISLTEIFYFNINKNKLNFMIYSTFCFLFAWLYLTSFTFRHSWRELEKTFNLTLA
jgi:hypothetical protein